jgi:hypothetical protein
VRTWPRAIRDDKARVQEVHMTRRTDPDNPAPKQAAPGAKLAARRKREAAALRANLRKRKDQAWAREKPKQE